MPRASSSDKPDEDPKPTKPTEPTTAPAEARKESWKPVDPIPGTKVPRIQSPSGGAMLERLPQLWRNLSREEHHAITVPDRVLNGSICGNGEVILASINGVMFFGMPGETYTVPCSVACQAYLAGVLPGAPCDKAKAQEVRRGFAFPPLAINEFYPNRQDRSKQALRGMMTGRRSFGNP